MFHKLILLTKNLSLLNTRRLFTNAVIGKEKWDLYAGILVSRLPVVTKEFNSIEKEFQQYLTQVEFEKSLKSNHELQHENDLKQAELLKKGQIEVDLDEAATKQTAQDLKDAYTDELSKFKFASRRTSDDTTNNLTSINRCLDNYLYLLVEKKIGNDNLYLLPQGRRVEGETMRQTAERILKEECGTQLQVQFYGNVPCGFYKYKYPKSLRNQSVGAKIFFYRATLKSGNVRTSAGKKYEWLLKEALVEKLQNSLYSESVQKFMI